MPVGNDAGGYGARRAQRWCVRRAVSSAAIDFPSRRRSAPGVRRPETHVRGGRRRAHRNPQPLRSLTPEHRSACCDTPRCIPRDSSASRAQATAQPPRSDRLRSMRHGVFRHRVAVDAGHPLRMVGQAHLRGAGRGGCQMSSERAPGRRARRRTGTRAARQYQAAAVGPDVTSRVVAPSSDGCLCRIRTRNPRPPRQIETEASQ